MDVQITIPQLYDGTTFYKLYVYCSTNMQAIDTISKVRNLQPSIIIDESIFDRSSDYFQNINGRDCYVIPANILNDIDHNVSGISWFNNDIKILPVSEYEVNVDVLEVNKSTYANVVKLNNIYTNDLGNMLYYSVIGVNTNTNQVTHLSKVAGVRVPFDFSKQARRELSYCDNYTGKTDDIWKVVTVADWDSTITIGDFFNKDTYSKYGCPFVDTVPIFKEDEVEISLKPLNLKGCILLSFPNPWQGKNRTYNYRRLKSFRIVNLYGTARSEPSEPTFQSLLPVTMERAYIFIESNARFDRKDYPIPFDTIKSPGPNTTIRTIFRKNGIYYSRDTYSKLGFNKTLIHMNEPVAIFSEASTQDNINIEIDVHPGGTYKITIYLLDLYDHISAPVTKFIRT